MSTSNLFSRLRRALLAVAASVMAGATAGAALAHNPLVVRVDEPRRPRPASRRP